MNGQEKKATIPGPGITSVCNLSKCDGVAMKNPKYVNGEIIFRGKRNDNSGHSGGWVYGDLIHDDLDFDTDTVFIRYDDRERYRYSMVEVIPETVGKGVYCEGKLVFEGDVLIVSDFSKKSPKYFYEMFYNKEYYCFSLRLIKVEWPASQYYDPVKIRELNRVKGFLFEVMGNKWDNPELYSE